MLGVERVVEMQYLARQGLNKVQISRRLGIDRKTVRKHLADPERARQGINRPSKLGPYKPYLRYQLEHRPELSSARLYREIQELSCPGQDGTELLPQEPYAGSERTVRRYVATIRPAQQRVYRPVETLPGEQAQVDWGHCGYITVDGTRKRCYAFSFVFSYSRVRYVEFTTSQDMLTFLACHQRALHYVGGVPQRILYDNCRTVVSERVGSVIEFNPELWRFAAQYGYKPEACWMHDPESKRKVESSMKYLKRDFLYARPREDLEGLNRAVIQWCDEVANEKRHGTTREAPSSRLADERRALGPLPAGPVPLFVQLTRRVRKDATFVFETNQYSVLHRYTRKSATLDVYRDRIEVFVGKERIAVHERCRGRGQLVLGAAHYEDRPYGSRQRKSELQARFEALGPAAAAYLRGLARERRGSLREQAEKILALVEA